MSVDKGVNLLIDFSSPVADDSRKPLIPMPCITGNLAVSPIDNNPFDVVATQTESPLLQNDPFELVFRTAFQGNCKAADPPEDGTLNDKHNISEVKNCHYLDAGNGVKENKIEQNKSDDGIEDISISDYSSIKLNDTDYMDTKSSQTDTPVKCYLETNMAENKYQDFVDSSSEERLRAVIASRVNKCIEKVLNNTGVSKSLNKTTDNLNESKSVYSCNVEQKHNRRSLSMSVIKKEFLQDYSNRSFAGGVFVLKNDTEILPLHKTIQSKGSSSLQLSQTPDCLNKGFINGSLLSSEECISPIISKDLDIGDESVFLSNDEQVFKEANKLANIFNKISVAKRQMSDSEGEDENDLMSCKPVLLYADSSEDEAELLCKDPSLNFHSNSIRLSRSYTNDTKSNEDSEALARFKNRYKDITSENGGKPLMNLNDGAFRRSHSWDAQTRAAPKTCPSAPVPVIVLNPEESLGVKQLRVKKVSAEPIRKGPLKAVVPLQNMTKPLEHKEENFSTEGDFPKHGQQSNICVVTPCKKIKEPIAASTPNRRHSGTTLSAQITPIVQTVNKPRRSLDSRNSVIPNNTSMKRSNSVNSCISTSVASKDKVVTTVPQGCKTKEINSSQVTKNGNIKSFEKKKPSLQSKLGIAKSRILGNLIKSSIPTSICTKTSTKLLTKRGVGLNPVEKDKENMVPI